MLFPQMWWVPDVAWRTRKARACWWKTRLSLNKPLTHLHTNAHLPEDQRSFTLGSLYCETDGRSWRFAALQKQIRPSTLYLTDYSSFTKSSYQHSVLQFLFIKFFLLFLLAGVQNNEYHNKILHCTEVGISVTNSVAQQRQPCEIVHIQYVFF